MKSGITKEKMIEIYNIAMLEYISNSIVGIKTLSKKYKIGASSFKRFLLKNNIYIKSDSEIKQKYTINHTFFDNIDTEAKAYILGLLFADGCLNKSPNNRLVSITLTEDDKDILTIINTILGSNKPLSYIRPRENRYSKKGSYKLILQNSNIYKTFCEKEYLNRKILPEIAANLFPHFIRGLFDGDGYISVGNRKCGKYTYFNGTFGLLLNYKHVAKSLSAIISKECGVSDLSVKDKTGSGNVIIYEIKWSGIDSILRIYNWLYKDATIFLSRKRNKFIELAEKNCRPL